MSSVYGLDYFDLPSSPNISSSSNFANSVKFEINCQNGTMRDLKIIWTEKPMGKGKVTYSGGPYQKYSIRDVLDGTYQRNLFKYIWLDKYQ